MDGFTIYAMRTDSNAVDDAVWKPRIYESLRSGVARFGWSSEPSSDLRRIAQKVSCGDTLSVPEQSAWENSFLLQIGLGDYLIYINLPDYGQCTLARVREKDPYRWTSEWTDFNHQILVDPESVKTFDRNDKTIVHPLLSARLKLQSRYWRIYAQEEFTRLLQFLRTAPEERMKRVGSNVQWLEEEIHEPLLKICKLIQHTHPRKDLEDFLAEIFRRVPNVLIDVCNAIEASLKSRYYYA